MARYIDAVNAAEIISDKLGIALSELVDVMATVPTADVREVKHGYWKFHKRTKLVPSNKVRLMVMIVLSLTIQMSTKKS